MHRPRRPRARSVLRAGIAALTATVMVSALPVIAVADSTDDYPIPNRMIVTTLHRRADPRRRTGFHADLL